MIFLDYEKINVPQTNTNNALIYTTPYLCMMFFVPIGSRMEDDAPVGLFVQNYFTDTDGGEARFYLYYSRALTGSTLLLNRMGPASSGETFYGNVPAIVPSGKNIRAFIANSSDRIGGTLYVFRIPE
jgi:hypothetical protein